MHLDGVPLVSCNSTGSKVLRDRNPKLRMQARELSQILDMYEMSI